MKNEPLRLELIVLPDQLELLERIRALPKVVEDSLGPIPHSFPAGPDEIQRIKELCESLEFHWKRWLWNIFIQSDGVSKVMDGVVLEKKTKWN